MRRTRSRPILIPLHLRSLRRCPRKYPRDRPVCKPAQLAAAGAALVRTGESTLLPPDRAPQPATAGPSRGGPGRAGWAARDCGNAGLGLGSATRGGHRSRARTPGSGSVGALVSTSFCTSQRRIYWGAARDRSPSAARFAAAHVLPVPRRTGPLPPRSFKALAI
ncbi:uncharacterized protein VK521_007304 [Ammospiza maritima maritima]